MIGAKNNMTTLAWWEQMPKDWYVQYLPKEEVSEKPVDPIQSFRIQKNSFTHS